MSIGGRLRIRRERRQRRNDTDQHEVLTVLVDYGYAGMDLLAAVLPLTRHRIAEALRSLHRQGFIGERWDQYVGETVYFAMPPIEDGRAK